MEQFLCRASRIPAIRLRSSSVQLWDLVNILLVFDAERLSRFGRATLCQQVQIDAESTPKSDDVDFTGIGLKDRGHGCCHRVDRWRRQVR